jgi:hypothetical protein
MEDWIRLCAICSLVVTMCLLWLILVQRFAVEIVQKPVENERIGIRCAVKQSPARLVVNGRQDLAERVKLDTCQVFIEEGRSDEERAGVV